MTNCLGASLLARIEYVAVRLSGVRGRMVVLLAVPVMEDDADGGG